MKIEIHPAALGDLLRVFDRLRERGEHAAHLFLALYIELVGLHAHAVFIRKGFARLNAHKHFLRARVLFG